MELEELIDEYKKMSSICYKTDYEDKKSVKQHNKAVDRMYEIINYINLHYSKRGVNEFASLLHVKVNRTNIWAAVQILEKMNVDDDIEKIALSIIKEEAEQSVGMEYWLKEYMNKNNISS